MHAYCSLDQLEGVRARSQRRCVDLILGLATSQRLDGLQRRGEIINIGIQVVARPQVRQIAAKERACETAYGNNGQWWLVILAWSGDHVHALCMHILAIHLLFHCYPMPLHGSCTVIARVRAGPHHMVTGSLLLARESLCGCNRCPELTHMECHCYPCTNISKRAAFAQSSTVPQTNQPSQPKLPTIMRMPNAHALNHKDALTLPTNTRGTASSKAAVLPAHMQHST